MLLQKYDGVEFRGLRAKEKRKFTKLVFFVRENSLSFTVVSYSSPSAIGVGLRSCLDRFRSVLYTLVCIYFGMALREHPFTTFNLLVFS